MRIKKRFFCILLLWVFTGLPIFIVGNGFLGDDAFTLRGVIGALRPDTESMGAFLSWFVGWALILFPLLIILGALISGRLVRRD
jgi:hypothetical protein